MLPYCFKSKQTEDGVLLRHAECAHHHFLPFRNGIGEMTNVAPYCRRGGRNGLDDDGVEQDAADICFDFREGNDWTKSHYQRRKWMARVRVEHL